VLGVVPIGPTHPSEMLSSAMENRVETVRNCMFTALETLSRQ
jgi:hypothetical protein